MTRKKGKAATPAAFRGYPGVPIAGGWQTREQWYKCSLLQGVHGVPANIKGLGNRLSGHGHSQSGGTYLGNAKDDLTTTVAGR